jgi:hypothetical protein
MEIDEKTVEVSAAELRKLLSRYGAVADHIENRFRVEKLGPWLSVLGPIVAAIIFGFGFYYKTTQRLDANEAATKSIREEMVRELVRVDEKASKNTDRLEGLRGDLNRNTGDIAILRDRAERK